MALRWIKDNIANFGGDTDRITIYGISAGGWSVSAHMVSPMSAGLFNRAISMSGSLYKVGLGADSRSERLEQARVFTTAMNCTDTETTEGILGCLREMPAKDLQSSSQGNMFPPLFGLPTFGDEFFPESVTDLYEKHQVCAF